MSVMNHPGPIRAKPNNIGWTIDSTIDMPIVQSSTIIEDYLRKTTLVYL